MTTLAQVRALAASAKYVIYDTNSLLTQVCTFGRVDPSKWKRVSMDASSVLPVAAALFETGIPHLVLPTVLTEASYFITTAPRHLQRGLQDGLMRIAHDWQERWTYSEELTANPYFRQLGLVDVDVLTHGDALVVTMDNPLLNARWSLGRLALDPRTDEP